MAKKKKKKNGGLFGIFSKKKKSKRSKRKKSTSFAAGLKITLSILFLAILFGGGAVGLIYLEAYAKRNAGDTAPEGPVVIKAPAIWLEDSQEWKNQIEAVLGSPTFPLNAASAQDICQKLNTVAWFKDVRVRTKSDHIEVVAEYRRPVGVVGSGKKKVYIGDDMTVMDYIPIPAIVDIEITGASSRPPAAGKHWAADDAEAAVELLGYLMTMDLHFQEQLRTEEDDPTPLKKRVPKKPLLKEIKSIDVSNYGSRSESNLVLNVIDGTKIYWGAAWGQATGSYEAAEKEKLARLYQYFMDNGDTLQGTARFIELRWLEDGIPRPR